MFCLILLMYSISIERLLFRTKFLFLSVFLLLFSCHSVDCAVLCLCFCLFHVMPSFLYSSIWHVGRIMWVGCNGSGVKLNIIDHVNYIVGCC
ncbi:hypothetical protein BZA70DRAFT_163320 [Myxozyma melibiosi]|uniref:Uncharacterized protein n=1 Tax=Myxozyma melibiosi TaxID=54550 RepID=A0ABR1F6U9_9ASCO